MFLTAMAVPAGADTAAQPDLALLAGKGQYRLMVTGWKGEEKNYECEMAALSGYRGWVTSTHSKNGILRISALVGFDARDPGMVSQQPASDSISAEEGALQYAQRVGFGEMTLYLYLPSCDHFSVQIFRSDFPDDMAVLPEPYKPGPEYEVGTISGRINTPDRDIVASPVLEHGYVPTG